MQTQELSPTLGAPVVDARCTYPRCSDADIYRMAGRCANCKSEPVVGLFTAGHEAASGYGSPECPVCSCRGSLYWLCLEDLWPK